MPGKNKASRRGSRISQAIQDLLHKTFPEGVVEMTVPPEESHLADLAPRLRARLNRVRGAALVYEREPEALLAWNDGDDPDEDPAADTGPSASYQVFFLALTDKRFRFQVDDEGEDEEGNPQKIVGEGWVGCVVAVSVLAPLAVLRFAQREDYDDGSQTLPDIYHSVFSLDGRPIPLEAYFQESFGSAAVLALTRLRNRLQKVLETLGIAVLPEAEGQQPVGWLDAGQDLFWRDADPGRPMTVQEAFFFEYS
jgi:hypothetical protein